MILTTTLEEPLSETGQSHKVTMGGKRAGTDDSGGFNPTKSQS